MVLALLGSLFQELKQVLFHSYFSNSARHLRFSPKMVRAQKKFSATRQCQISSSEPGKEFVGKAERQYSSILDTGPMPLFQESATASLKDLVRWTSHASIFHQNGTIQAPHSRRKMLRLKAKTKRLYLNEAFRVLEELVAFASFALGTWSILESWDGDCSNAFMRPPRCMSFRFCSCWQYFDTFWKWQWPQDHPVLTLGLLRRTCTTHAQITARADGSDAKSWFMMVVTATIGHVFVRPGAAVLRFRYGKLWGSKRKQTSRKDSDESVTWLTCDPTLLQHDAKVWNLSRKAPPEFHAAQTSTSQPLSSAVLISNLLYIEWWCVRCPTSKHQDPFHPWRKHIEHAQSKQINEIQWVQQAEWSRMKLQSTMHHNPQLRRASW